METLKNDINPRFQLADIRAFTLPSSNGVSGTGASTWTGLGLIPDLVRGVEAGLKLTKPLASQISGIPAVMNIKTGLFAAPTGCGKTLTYLLPLFQHLKNDEKVKIGAIGDSNTKTDAKIITDTNDSNTNTEINTDTNDSNTNTEINTDTNDSNINTKIETKDSNTEINTDINDSDTNTKTDTKTKMDTSNVSLKSSISIGPRALILVPTHELVRQVYATAKTLSHYAKLRVETIDTVFKHGKTQGAVDQIDILISTPRSLLRNRIEAPIKSKNSIILLVQLILFFLVKTGAISRVIIDEADTLFSADFALDMKQILMQSGLPRENLQVLATSATITKQLQRTMQTLFPQVNNV
jgi:superfamily II DNA/RNA helicase